MDFLEGRAVREAGFVDDVDVMEVDSSHLGASRESPSFQSGHGIGDMDLSDGLPSGIADDLAHLGIVQNTVDDTICWGV